MTRESTGSGVAIIPFEDFVKWDIDDNPEILFHGTGTVFSDRIESQGWCPRSAPYELEEILELSRVIKKICGSNQIWLEYNLNLQRKGTRSFFTYLLVGAVQYSRFGGGELIGYAVEAMNIVFEKFDPHTILGKQELNFLLKIKENFTSMISMHKPIIYGVRASERDFPGTELKIRGWPEWKSMGNPLDKPGDISSTNTITHQCIIGKAFVPEEFIKNPMELDRIIKESRKRNRVVS